MIKKLVILILPLFIFANETYSLQFGTFSTKSSAQKFLKDIEQKLKKKDIFLYKTDSGFWTVRYFLSDYKSTLKESKNLSSKYSIVPTNPEKVLKKRDKKIQVSKNMEEKKLILEMKKFNSEIVDSYTVFVEIHDMFYTVQYTKNKNPLSEQFLKETLIDKRFLNSITLIRDDSKIVVQLEDKNLDKFKHRILEIIEKNKKTPNLKIRWRTVIH